MKLNQQCMLDILCLIEESIVVKHVKNIHLRKNDYKIEAVESNLIFENEPLLQRYSSEELFYSLYCLVKAECIEAIGKPSENTPDSWDIKDITLTGHKFIATKALF